MSENTAPKITMSLSAKTGKRFLPPLAPPTFSLHQNKHPTRYTAFFQQIKIKSWFIHILGKLIHTMLSNWFPGCNLVSKFFSAKCQSHSPRPITLYKKTEIVYFSLKLKTRSFLHHWDFTPPCPINAPLPGAPKTQSTGNSQLYLAMKTVLTVGNLQQLGVTSTGGLHLKKELHHSKR